VLVGTRKGLFLLRGDQSRREWKLEGPLLTGWKVFHAIRDARDSAVYVAANNWVYGATVQRSDDLGESWERSEGLGLPEDAELTLEKSWHVEAGADGDLYLGAARRRVARGRARVARRWSGRRRLADRRRNI
jgi:hypothetical protein